MSKVCVEQTLFVDGPLYSALQRVVRGFNSWVQFRGNEVGDEGNRRSGARRLASARPAVVAPRAGGATGSFVGSLYRPATMRKIKKNISGAVASVGASLRGAKKRDAGARGVAGMRRAARAAGPGATRQICGVPRRTRARGALHRQVLGLPERSCSELCAPPSRR